MERQELQTALHRSGTVMSKGTATARLHHGKPARGDGLELKVDPRAWVQSICHPEYARARNFYRLAVVLE